MIYIGIILFAVWNGFVIRAQQNKFGTRTRDRNIWHKVGILNRGVVWLLGMTLSLSVVFPEYSYIMNPIDIWFTEWFSIALTTLLAIGLCYWIYNLIINVINKWKWDYQQELSPNVYRFSFYAYIIVLIMGVVHGITNGLKI